MTTVCLTFDFDAVSIWVSSFRQTSPTPLSRGEFGAEVGIARILAMLARQRVPATFFTPAHTARSFPEKVRALVEAGHEIALHGYVHESPVGLDIGEERRLLMLSSDCLYELAGVRPVGYRSPAWDLSPNSISLMEELGLRYDSSLMNGDYQPYFARIGDAVTEQMFTRGRTSRVVEFPVAWELDDFPYFHFGWKPFTPGLRSTQDVFVAWKEEFDAAHDIGGVFTLTCHPEVIGRTPRLAMLERLVSYMRSKPGVRFLSMADACSEYLFQQVATN